MELRGEWLLFCRDFLRDVAQISPIRLLFSWALLDLGTYFLMSLFFLLGTTTTMVALNTDFLYVTFDIDSFVHPTNPGLQIPLIENLASHQGTYDTLNLTDNSIISLGNIPLCEYGLTLYLYSVHTSFSILFAKSRNNMLTFNFPLISL